MMTAPATSPRRTQDADEVRRVLIFLLGSLGDTTVALPALHAVSREFPRAQRRVLTQFSMNAKAIPMSQLLDGTGLVHGYFQVPFASGNAPRLRQFASLIREVRAWKPEVLVYMHGQAGRRIAIRDWAAFKAMGITRMIGLPFTKDLQEIRFNQSENRYEDRPEYLARTLAPLGDLRLSDPASWSLSITEAELARANEALKRLGPATGILAMSIGTKIEVNDWGDSNWSEVLGVVGRKFPHWALIAVGAQIERKRSEALLKAWVGPCLNLCGDLQVRESAAVLRRANTFIGHDSGPMHLAASVGTRCVAIFSARNLPGRWFPHGTGHQVFYRKTECAGCELSVCIEHKKKCINAITPAEVAAAVISAVEASVGGANT
jgi:heptosyltransferase-3